MPNNDHQRYYIYMIECRNGHFYTGYTTDLERRYQEHVRGTAKCKYTRSFPPKRLAASWEINADLSTALKLERAIKKLPRQQKLVLISNKKLKINGNILCSEIKLSSPTKRNENLG